jgi:nucleoid-associated protein YgaU
MSNDKPKPDFSNVKGGSSSSAPKPSRPDFSNVKGGSSSTAPSAATEQVYEVVAGDSLSKISKKVYGDANQWRRIFDANRDQIKNPDLIQPGWKLKIPPKK